MTASRPVAPARRWAAVAVVLAWTLAGNRLPAQSAPPKPSPPVRDGDRIRFGRVTVDPAARRISLPARLNQTNGALEYALVTDYGKTHESLFITEAAPLDLQAALLLLNARPCGTNALANSGTHTTVPPAHAVDVHVQWAGGAGANRRQPLHELVVLAAPGPTIQPTGALAPGPWLFSGSTFTSEGFAAHFEGSLVALITDPVAIVNSLRADRDDDEIHFPKPGALPTNGTAATIEFEVPAGRR